jgi:hypothetical protein
MEIVVFSHLIIPVIIVVPVLILLFLPSAPLREGGSRPTGEGKPSVSAWMFRVPSPLVSSDPLTLAPPKDAADVVESEIPALPAAIRFAMMCSMSGRRFSRISGHFIA